MKSIFLALVSLLVLDVTGLAQDAQRAPLVVLIGDSTVADPRPGGKGTYGWGYFLQEELPGIKVTNLAVSGASTKSFLTLEEYEKAKETKADFWLIQFGHNDSKPNSPKYAPAETDFQTNLRQMIADARKTGAQPVIITPVRRMTRQSDGKLGEELLPYADAAKKVAEEENVPVIDLNTISGGVFQSFGPDNQDWITADKTHFTFHGGRLVSLLVAQQLVKLFPQTFIPPKS